MALTTPSPPIVDPELFRFIAALEVHKAARLRYPLSLLTFELPANAEPLAVAKALARVIRSTDLITSQPERFGLQMLLIDAGPNDAQAVIQCLREIVPNGDVVQCRVRSFPATATSLEDLLSTPSTSTTALPKGMDDEESAASE
jgi:hypothetical protein